MMNHPAPCESRHPGGVCGALMAGGRSTRMGRDKALLETGGKALWLRQWESLEALTARVAVVAPARPDWLPDAYSWIADLAPGGGPASGLAGAMGWAAGEGAGHVLVLAVDMPRISPGFLRSLLGAARPGVGVVPLGDHGYEPLCAVYPAGSGGFAAECLRQGEKRVRNLVARLVDQGSMTVRKLSFFEHEEFLNVNTPSDWKQVEDAE